MNASFNDYIILGAGPAGLQLGYYFEKSKVDYKILEAGDSVGTSFKTFPRHRTLISINKVFTGFDDNEINMRWDWNSLLTDDNDVLFKDFDKSYFPNADSLVEYLVHYANTFGMNIDLNQRICKISREGSDGQFVLETTDGSVYTCNKLIVATGFQRANVPGIPGIELADCYTRVSVDEQDYVNQDVLILGKGNSAFEMADSLTQTAAVIHVISPEVLKFAWQTHYVGDLRAVNNNFLDTYQLKSQNALLNGYVDAIRYEDGKYQVDISYIIANGERETLTYDKVINCTGFKFDDSIFDEAIRPQLCQMNKFPAQTNEWESTNIPGLYFAGTLTHMRDYRKTTSGFIHGFRYNVKALAKLLARKYEAVDIESAAMATDVESIIKSTLARANRSSALWQQFGFLVDVIDLSDDGDQGRYYEELPADYVHEVYFKDCSRYLTMSLEFGAIPEQPFAIERDPDPTKAQDSVFLHPVFRLFESGKPVKELHLLEDLYGMWKHETQHIKPLREFLTEALAVGAMA